MVYQREAERGFTLSSLCSHPTAPSPPLPLAQYAALPTAADMEAALPSDSEGEEEPPLIRVSARAASVWPGLPKLLSGKPAREFAVHPGNPNPK